MRHLTRIMAAAAFGLGLVLAGAGPAAAQTATFSGFGVVTLEQHGLIGDLPVTYVCDGAQFVQIEAGIQQRLSAVLTTWGDSFASSTEPCTGQPQTLTVRIPVSPGMAPFRPGVAQAYAAVYICADGMCEWGDGTGMRPIQIH